MLKALRIFIPIIVAFFVVQGCSSQKSQTPPGDGASNTNLKSMSKTVSPSNGNKKTNESSGVLIGIAKNKLVDDQKVSDGYRTLWISQNGETIKSSEVEGKIITPYGDDFWILKNKQFDYENKGEHISYHYNYAISSPKGKNPSDIIGMDSLPATLSGDIWDTRKLYERLLFVGSKYALLERSEEETGGGSYLSHWDRYRVIDIADLVSLESRNKLSPVKLFIDGNIQDEVQQLEAKYNKIEDNTNKIKSMKEEQKINSDDMMVYHSEGSWKVKIPLYNFYTHTGNGSDSRRLIKFFPVGGNVVKEFSSYDEMTIPWQNVKKAVPEASDAAVSPNKSLAFVVCGNELRVYSQPEKGFTKPDLKIPMGKDEDIISIQWALNNSVQKWDTKMGTIDVN
jgi:hypothetical protein